MSVKCSLRLTVAAAMVGAAFSTPIRAEEPATDRVAALEARLQALEAELQQYKKQNSNVSAATADKVYAAAQANSQLATGGRVGYSNGLFLATDDSKFQLKVNGLLQPRYILNHNHDSTGDTTESGFQMRRAELYLNGHAFRPEFMYHFSGGYDRATGNFGLVSAYAAYQVSKEVEIRGGAFKPPFMIEELTSASRQQAVERSFVNTYFTAGTSEGFQAQYQSANWRVAGMIHDGSNAVASDFASDNTDFGFAARGEWKIAGDWSQFSDFNGWDKSKYASRLGAAIDYEAGEGGVDAPDQIKYTVDLTVKGSNWNVLVAGVARHQSGFGAVESADQYGLLLQGGVFVIPNRLELFSRYERLCLDGFFSTSAAPVDNNINLVTVGANWFFLGHNAKLTTDIIYVADEVPAGSTSIGLLPSDNGSQVIVRTGLSLFF